MVEHFLLNNESIDSVSGQVGVFLAQERVAPKDILRTRLMVEELLLTYKDVLGDGAAFSIRLCKRFGRLRMDITLPGKQYDPLPADDASTMWRHILAQAGLVPVWQYKNGQNILSFSPRKKTPSQMLQLAVAVLLALLAGGIFSFLPAQWGVLVSEQVVSHVFQAFIDFLSALACFVILFSLVWGIISTGDMASFEKIGKKLLSRVARMTLLLLVCCTALVLPLFPLSFTGSSGFLAADLFHLVLDIIPDNFISPFLEGNLLQIVFLSVILGIAILTLGEKASVFSTIIEQGTGVLNLIMDAAGACIPVLVFLSLLDMILTGRVMAVFQSYKLLLLVVAGAFFVMLVYFLLCLRLKVPAMLLLKKLMPATLIALTTASSAAALPVSMEICEKKLGIDKSLVRFSLPLYQVVFMVITAMEYFIMVLCMYELYELAISPAVLIVSLSTALLLAIATPPTPGSGAAVFVILFSQVGIPPEAIAIAVSIDILLDYIVTSSEAFCQQCELLLLASSLDLVDADTLHADL